MDDGDKWFSILPPFNAIEAQLIQRDELPLIITEDVEIRYKIETGFENPAAHTSFWDYAEELYGAKDLPKNIGLKGHGMSGTLEYDEVKSAFVAEGIPALPYNNNGTYNLILQWM